MYVLLKVLFYFKLDLSRKTKKGCFYSQVQHQTSGLPQICNRSPLGEPLDERWSSCKKKPSSLEQFSASLNHYSCSSPSSPTATNLFEGTGKIYRVMCLELTFALLAYLLKLLDVPTESRQGPFGAMVSFPSCSLW